MWPKVRYWMKLLLAMLSLLILFQITTGSWWLGGLAILFYLGRGFWQGWQEERQKQQARHYSPMSSEEARILLRRERWRNPQ